MRAYKFRSLKNFEYIADIFCNKRFYAAQFYDLNDPVEIRSLYLGVRTPAPLKEALLRMVPEGVVVYETSISRKTNRVIKAQQVINRTR